MQRAVAINLESKRKSSSTAAAGNETWASQPAKKALKEIQFSAAPATGVFHHPFRQLCIVVSSIVLCMNAAAVACEKKEACTTTK